MYITAVSYEHSLLQLEDMFKFKISNIQSFFFK